jgi:hypothetical protein
MTERRMTTKELSDRIDKIELDLSNRLNLINVKLSNKVDNLVLTKLEKGVDKSGQWLVIYIFIMFVFGFITAFIVCNKIATKTMTTDTTETTVVVKPISKDTELKKIVEKVPATDRKKLAECIENALETETTEAYEIRDELHDQIKLTFDDAEETIWKPFRIWIEKQKPDDTVDSTKKIYKTIQEALNVTFKQSW